jgi:hypothetical protein
LVNFWAGKHKKAAGLVAPDLNDEAKVQEVGDFLKKARKDKKYVCDKELDYDTELALTKV